MEFAKDSRKNIFIREEWPFPDKAILSNHHIDVNLEFEYIYIYLFIDLYIFIYILYTYILHTYDIGKGKRFRYLRSSALPTPPFPQPWDLWMWWPWALPEVLVIHWRGVTLAMPSVQDVTSILTSTSLASELTTWREREREIWREREI